MLVGACSSAPESTPRCCVRRDGVQTSASVLPIRPDGSRPAFHVVGANATYGPDDVPWDELDGVTHLHLGGPEFMGGEAAAEILAQGARARDRHLRRRPRPGRAGRARVDRPGARRPRLLPPQRRPGPRLHRHRRPRGGVPVARRAGRRLRRGRPAAPTASFSSTPRARCACRPSTSRSSTPPAAATPSRPASCAASRSGATARRPPRSVAPQRGLVAGGLGSDHGDFDLAAADALIASGLSA